MNGKQKKIRSAEILIIVLLVLGLLLPQVIGTTKVESQKAEDAVSTIEELDGKSFVTVTGSIFEEHLLEQYPNSPLIYVSDWADMALSVRQGKAYAMLLEESVVGEYTEMYPELTVMPEIAGTMEGSWAAPNTEEGKALISQVDAYIAETEASGLLDELWETWSDQDAAPDYVEPVAMTGEDKGTLRIVTCLDWTPLCYSNNGQPCGYFIDLCYHFCAWAGYTPEFEYADIQSALAGFAAGKYDLFCYGVTPSQEREEEMVFSVPLTSDPLHVLVLEENYAYSTVEQCDLDSLNTEDTVIAVLTGSELSESAEKLFPLAQLDSYDTLSDMFAAVAGGKADACPVFADCLGEISESYPELGFYYSPIADYDYGFAAQKSQKGEALTEELNAFFASMQDSGEMDAMMEKWASDSPQKAEYTFTGENGVLKVATLGTWYPNSYYEGDTLTGMFIELVDAFCQESGYIPEYTTLNYTSETTGICSGEFDLVADSVCITEERLESVDITEPILHSTLYLLVPMEDGGGEIVSKASVFLDNLISGFEKNFLRENRWKMLLSGLGVTVALAILAGIFGTVLGCVVCAMRMSKSAFLSAMARLYTKIFRGMPTVVMLLVLYYVVFGSTDVSAFWVCVLGFSLDFGAYTSEIFRSGIEAVPAGQLRAARALGFTPFHAFRKVVLPQAMLHILPVYSGQFISMVKMTSVAGYISVQDLTKVSDIIRARTFEPFFPLISTAVIYFAISALLVSALKILERRANPALRPRIVKGVR